jgi:hypothetical protein
MNAFGMAGGQTVGGEKGGWYAEHPCRATITLETAQPAKFPDVMDAFREWLLRM